MVEDIGRIIGSGFAAQPVIVVVGSRRRLNQGAERPGVAELAGVNLPGFNPYGIIYYKYLT